MENGGSCFIGKKSGNDVSVQSVSSITLEPMQEGNRLHCVGDWTLATLMYLESQLAVLKTIEPSNLTIDVSQIDRLDSAGALLLRRMIDALDQQGYHVTLLGLKKKQQALYTLVQEEAATMKAAAKIQRNPNGFYRIGAWVVNKYWQIKSFFTFIGELMITIIQSVLEPTRIQWRLTFKAIDETGCQALSIIALMSFLIGIVLAYQLGEQLKTYGADIFIVNITGIGILREFGPLITAIILAGRTSTSFAALIGTMKVNEEIDVLHTMGISPIERLVLPRLFALIIVFPLLIIWSDIFGVLGSMVMAHHMMGMSMYAFLERFQATISVKQLILGVVKGPVYAMIIVSVGCFQGFQVGSSAESVGKQTTKSAVQAIFLIIIADAAFSILYSMMKI